MFPPALLDIPDAEIEFDTPSHVYIYLPNGWSISVLWGFRDYGSITPNALAFTGKSVRSAEKTYPENVVESPRLEDFISFINEVAAFPPYVKEKPSDTTN